MRGFALGTDVAATRTDSYDGDRTGFSLRLDRRLAGHLRVERTDGRLKPGDGDGGAGDSLLAADSAERSRDLDVAELRTTFSRLTPRLHYEREERVDTGSESRSGLAYTQFGGGTEIGLPAGARALIDFRRRHDRHLGATSPWTDLQRSFEQSYRLEVPRARSVSLSGAYTRRSSHDLRSDSKQISDLIQVDLLHASHNGGFESETHYDVTTTDVSSEGQELVFVGEGAGAYDEFGRFVGSGGDYALLRGDAGSSDLRTQLRLSMRGEVRPRRFLGSPSKLHGAGRLLAALGFETTMEVDELTKLNLASPSRLFDLSSYQRDGATFLGNFFLRQDVDILEANRLVNLRLRAERRDQADNRIDGVEQDLAVRNQAVRLRSTPWSPFTAELEQSWGSQLEKEAAAAAGGEVDRFDVTTGATALDLVGRPGGSMRLELLIRRQVDEERNGAARARRLEITPSFTTHVRQARIDCRYRRLDEEREGVFPASYRVGSSAGVRNEYDVNVDYRATDHVTVSGGVEGIRPPQQSFNHTARVEVRAFF
jgi:hypothetical protein